VLLCFTTNIKAQSIKDDLFSNKLNFATIIMPLLNNDSLINYYDSQSKNNPYVFAQLIHQDIKTNSNGTWIKNNKSLSWLCKIESKAAYSLNFTLENINIPKESSLYVLSLKNNLTLGPYHSKSISNDSSLFIEPIPGEEVIFELDLPLNSDTTISYFTITKVGHDFRNFYKESSSTRGVAGSCEHDINCGIGLDWQIEKHSIVKYIFNTALGTESCTGTLINNTANNELPYILTANHCIRDNKTASTAIFYFNYENTKCGISDALSNSYSISGSTLMATSKDTLNSKLDFTLLRLKTAPPKSISPYYSGWSIKTNTVNNVVCIHHPKGDAKKISNENDFIKNGSFTDYGYLKDSHWQIAKWDTGVTEPGSSGSPLFNSNHQIIGNLSGGIAACGNPINDFFEKLYKSWDFFPDSSNQLKYWLDPLNLGVTECNGYDPLLGSDNPISNIKFDEELITYNFGKAYQGGWTGYNEPQLKQCADRFSGIKNQYIYAIKFPVQLLNKTTDISKIKLKIWNGIDKPDSLIFEQSLSKDSLITGKYYCLRLKNRIKAGSDFYIGFDFTNSNKLDSIRFFTAKTRSNKSNSLYYYYKNQWVESKYLGLYSSLGIEVYVTDNISPAKILSNLPEKLISIPLNKTDSLITKELFHTDSLCNYAEKNWLQLHYLKEEKGIWSGTNNYNMSQFAEKYTIGEDRYLSGIKIAVAKNTITSSSSKLRLSIMTGNEFPDSTLYSEEINTSELKPSFYNVIKFANPLLIDSTFFVVLNTENILYPDTFAMYMGDPVNSDKKNNKHSYFKSTYDWLNYSMYDIPENLGLSIETNYSKYVFDTNATNYNYAIKNPIKPSNIIFKSFFIYPNPTTSITKSITLNFGNYFTTNYKITIYDVFGRVVSNPSPTLDYGNKVEIPIDDLSPAVYFVKVTIDNILFKPVQLIIIQ
jgi:lysyl endopeptidase